MQSWHHQERPDMYVLARAGSSPCTYRARSKGQPDGRPDSGTHCEEDLYSRLHEAEGRCGFLSLLGLSALPGQVRPENIWCKSIRPELRRQQAWQKRLQDGSVRTFPCKCRPAWQYFHLDALRGERPCRRSISGKAAATKGHSEKACSSQAENFLIHDSFLLSSN